MELNRVNSVGFYGISHAKNAENKPAVQTKIADTSSLDAMEASGRAFINMSKTKETNDKPISYNEKIEIIKKLGIKDKTGIKNVLAFDDNAFQNFVLYKAGGRSFNTAINLAQLSGDAKKEAERVLSLGFEKMLDEKTNYNQKDIAKLSIMSDETRKAILKLADYDINLPEARHELAIKEKDLSADFIKCAEKHPNIPREYIALALASNCQDAVFACFDAGINPFEVPRKRKSIYDVSLQHDNYKDIKNNGGFDDQVYDINGIIEILKMGGSVENAFVYSTIAKDRMDYIKELSGNKKFNIEECLKCAKETADDAPRSEWEDKIFSSSVKDSYSFANDNVLKKLTSLFGDEKQTFKALSQEDIRDYELSRIEPERLQKIKSRMNDGFTAYDAYKLTDYWHEKNADKIIEISKKGISIQDACVLYSLDETQRQKAISLIKKGAPALLARNLVEENADEDIQEKAIYYGKYFYDSDKIAQSKTARKYADYYIESKKIDDSVFLKSFYSSYEKDKENYAKALEYAETGYDLDFALYCIKKGFSKEKILDILKMSQDGIDEYGIKGIYDEIKDEESQEIVFDLIKNKKQTSPYSIANAAWRASMPVKEFSKYLQNGAKPDAAGAIVAEKFSDKMEKFLLYCSENDLYQYTGYYNDEIREIEDDGLLNSDERLNLAIEFAKRGICDNSVLDKSSVSDAIYFAQFDYKNEEEINRTVELYKLGAVGVDAYLFAKDKDAYIEKRNSLIANGKDESCERFNELRDVAYIVNKYGADFEEALELVGAHAKYAFDKSKSIKEINYNDIKDYASKNKIDIKYSFIFNQYPSKKKILENLINKGFNPKTAQVMAYANVNENDKEKIELIEHVSANTAADDINKKVQNPNIKENIEYIFSNLVSEPINMRELVNSGMSYEDIIDGASNFSKKSLKLAMKKPNQYLSHIPIELTTKINGKYPVLQGKELAKYQKQFLDEIKRDMILPTTIKMAHCLDADTFNQIMDKRTDAFKDFLIDFAELDKSDRDLITKLINLKTPDNKPLTAKDKIDITKLIMSLNEAQLEYGELGELEEIDLPKIKIKTLKDTFKLLGFSEEEFDSIPKEKLNFDKDWVHLILKSDNSDSFRYFYNEYIAPMKNSEEERTASLIKLEEMLEDKDDLLHDGIKPEAFENFVETVRNNPNMSKKELFRLYDAMFIKNTSDSPSGIKNVIKMATSGDFKTEIQDTSNQVGKANLKTKQEFIKSGLDYDKWFNKDEKHDLEVQLNGKNFKITMWDRVPQKDLFLGNKTSCCTAMGAGNGGATPIYLGNSAFNVVEMKDEKGNTVAMSRIFMAKDDNKKPALIMENIETNQEFLKYLNKEKQHEVIDAFACYMKNFAKDVAGNDDTKIYFSTSYTKLDTENLKSTSRAVDFIGKISDDKVYLNTAREWINPERLKDRYTSFYEL